MRSGCLAAMTVCFNVNHQHSAIAYLTGGKHARTRGCLVPCKHVLCILHIWLIHLSVCNAMAVLKRLCGSLLNDHVFAP